MGGEQGWLSSATRALARAASERRRGHRAEVAGLWCDRGQVIDLSTRGMRMTSLRRWSEGQVRRVTIADSQHHATVDARCVWCRQEGLFHHLVGLSFEDTTPEQERLIARIMERGEA